MGCGASSRDPVQLRDGDLTDAPFSPDEEILETQAPQQHIEQKDEQQKEHDREQREENAVSSLTCTMPIPVQPEELGPILLTEAQLDRELSRTSRDSAKALTRVTAQSITKDDLKRRICNLGPAGYSHAQGFQQTLLDCVDIMAGGAGGVILAVVDKEVLSDLQFSYLDGGLLMDLCQHVSSNIHQCADAFGEILTGFSAHNSSDRWEQPELERLSWKLPQSAAPLLAKLQGNPKDGAFILSHSGTLVAAAGHLRYSSARFQLVRADGRSTGTRHAASLAFVEWLGSANRLGAVFARSDGGGVHAMLPAGTEPPLVFHFDSMRPKTQIEMLELFKHTIMSQGRLMHKVQMGMIRLGVCGEHVVTCVNGRVTSDVTVNDHTSMVVRAATVNQELYVLPQDKFADNWEHEGTSLDEVNNPTTHGFKLHRPKRGKQKWIYQCTAKDLALVPIGCFEASWGALQPLIAGDYLAMPAPEESATEVYLMDADCVSCYAEVGQTMSLMTRQTSSGSTSPTSPGSPKHRTQAELLHLFKSKIMDQGRLMCKVEPCMSRLGKLGEHVVTCVGGRITSDVTIEDETSMVVRAPTVNHELYVLTRAKFEQNWEQPGTVLDQNSPAHRLLASQGFKLYMPKPNLKWVYALTADDMVLLPTRWFFSSWGALQPVEEGDCLAMPAPKDRAKEIYLMPMDVLTCYSEFQRSCSPSHVIKAGGHCTQQAMLSMFQEVAKKEGVLMRKVQKGLLRPGCRGERVLTYVNGRVISDVVIEDETCMVVRAHTVDREEYVLPRAKCEANWESLGEDLGDKTPELASLRSRGYKEYLPKANMKWIYKLTSDDLARVPTGFFFASWGALQPVREGDYLAMPAEGCEFPELYLMPPECLACYAACLLDQGAEHLAAQPSPSDQLMSTNTDFTQTCLSIS